MMDILKTFIQLLIVLYIHAKQNQDVYIYIATDSHGKMLFLLKYEFFWVRRVADAKFFSLRFSQHHSPDHFIGRQSLRYIHS